jgi:O-acetyl-ADP-ribose deacetylase
LLNWSSLSCLLSLSIKFFLSYTSTGQQFSAQGLHSPLVTLAIVSLRKVFSLLILPNEANSGQVAIFLRLIFARANQNCKYATLEISAISFQIIPELTAAIPKQEEVRMSKPRLEIIQGDITNMKVDAIVNAANQTLLGGGGVDGAIHRAAGPELKRECQSLGGCKSGEAKLTGGYRLPATYVIHTVGPIWHGGDRNEDAILANCYQNSLKAAVENGISTIAFPSISTGAYGFPLDRACRIALHAVKTFLDHHAEIKKVYFVCFSENDLGEYQRAYEALQAEANSPII